MKKLLSFLGALGLTAVGAAGVVSCGTSESDSTITPAKDGTVTTTVKATLSNELTADAAKAAINVYNDKFDTTKPTENKVEGATVDFKSADDSKNFGKTGKDIKDIDVEFTVKFAAPKADSTADKTYSYTIASVTKDKGSNDVVKALSTIKVKVAKEAAKPTVTDLTKVTLDGAKSTTTATTFTLKASEKLIQTTLPNEDIASIAVAKGTAEAEPAAATVNVKSITVKDDLIIVTVDGTLVNGNELTVTLKSGVFKTADPITVTVAIA